MLNWLRNRKTTPESAAPDKAEEPQSREWIGVDLDGTLAEYHKWKGIDHIGKPIPLMKERVLNWLRDGYTIKIFTARASVPEGIAPVEKWLEKHGFPPLEVTNQKDFLMLEVWDDRAIQVVHNTGKAILRSQLNSKPKAPLLGRETAAATCEMGKMERPEDQSGKNAEKK
ncbi:hypothetical protein IEN85_18825 [Pelagicoccus sp. NFK12]|uniref:Polynucleotide kinase n=1 Tax=Pelagicoccus enzymogenes TaxID=2773457 RepID=A0A927FDU4_9BACT|nr:hypothetical protein [Pelagicoccus enzymogenes]MBD5781563.1 hypothetical protein [Pelagicoccus enzymogenes]